MKETEEVQCFFSSLLAQNTPWEKAPYTRHKPANVSLKVDTCYHLVSSRNFHPSAAWTSSSIPHNHIVFLFYRTSSRTVSELSLDLSRLWFPLFSLASCWRKLTYLVLGSIRGYKVLKSLLILFKNGFPTSQLLLYKLVYCLSCALWCQNHAPATSPQGCLLRPRCWCSSPTFCSWSLAVGFYFSSISKLG